MDARDDIYLIFFVLRDNPNLENYVDFFKYLIDINKERIKMNKKKINIIFIINQSMNSSEDSLFKFLKDNKLMKL